MKVNSVLVGFCLLFLGATTFGRSLVSMQVQIPPSQVKVSPAPRPVQMEIPPPKAQLPFVKMELPPASSTKPAPEAGEVPGVKPALEISAQDAARVSQSNADYAVWQNNFTRRTYENQMIQTRIIFLLVLVMVCAGLFFSWLQFQHSLHLRQVIKCRVTQGDSANADPVPPPDEFAFGKDGVVIRSAYLGVIILVISMAFFFLYLKFVYLIT